MESKNCRLRNCSNNKKVSTALNSDFKMGKRVYNQRYDSKFYQEGKIKYALSNRIM